jgi:uncharacterized protein (TIGR02302 family)
VTSESRTLARKLRLTAAAMVWERLWPALWPLTATLALFLVLAVFDLFGWLPGWLHVLVLAGFAVSIAWAVRSALGEFQWPEAEAAHRRLERGSGVAHRPLETLIDEISGNPIAATQTMWSAHKSRAWRMISNLRVTAPSDGLARRDPRGIRAALGLLLLIGFVSAGPTWQARLAGAFVPDFSSGAGDGIEFVAWITPPDYTGVAPIFLTQASGGNAVNVAEATVIRTPAGSTFHAQVSGSKTQPALGQDDRRMAFEMIDTNNFQIDRLLETGGAFAVIQGRKELGRWQIELVPDAAPQINFVEEIAVNDRGAMGIQYRATDDYGLARTWMRIRRTDLTADAAVGAADLTADAAGGAADADNAELTLDLPLAGVSQLAVDGAREFDLTPHPWAGLPVAITLLAADGAEQIGQSRTIEMILPQREFRNPVARAVIEQRRDLAADPETRDRVAFALDAIADARAEEIEDFGIYLSLRSSISRLKFDETDAAVAEVIDQLWDTALALEDGQLGLAERDLRQAQQALQDALERGADDAEIERLMDELQEALNEYLEALIEQGLENAEGEPGAPNPDGRQVDRQSLNEMLAEARELSRLGSREAAQQLLAELQEILENLRAGNAPREGDGAAAQAMRELGELMQDQQQLLDRTFQQAQRGAFGDPNLAPAPGEQGEVTEGLGELMEGLEGMLGEGQLPGALGEAQQAMRGAGEALRNGDLGAAADLQTQALDQLRQGAAQLLEQLITAAGQQPGGQNVQRIPQPALDPLGRPLPGLGADTSNRIQVPDEADLQRARDILEELFRRAGERTRPLFELDYIDRLLRRF